MRYRPIETHSPSYDRNSRKEIRHDQGNGFSRAGNRAGQHLESPMTHRPKDVMPIEQQQALP
jgi:hypothetical protein